MHATNDDTPEEVADDIVDAICTWAEMCGTWEVSCSDSDCMAIHHDVTYEGCVADEERSDVEGLAACVLEAGRADVINDCLNPQLSRSCLTQEEADAYLEALEAGENPPPLGGETPAACEELDTFSESCQ